MAYTDSMDTYLDRFLATPSPASPVTAQAATSAPAPVVTSDAPETFLDRFLATPTPEAPTASGGIKSAPIFEWPKEEEQKFQEWYKGWSTELGMDKNPDNPVHQYDFREAYQKQAFPTPDKEGNYLWPAEFGRVGARKSEGGVNVKPPPEGEFVKSLAQGIGAGLLTDLPGFGGSILSYVGHTIGQATKGFDGGAAKAIEDAGADISKYFEEKSDEWFDNSKERTLLDKWAYQGMKIIAPALVPYIGSRVAFGTLFGIGKNLLRSKQALTLAATAEDAVKAAKYMEMSQAFGLEAAAMAKKAHKYASATVAGIFGGSQAGQTQKAGLARVAQLEAEGKYEEARQVRSWTEGAAPVINGLIEGAMEFVGTKYLGKFLGLDDIAATGRSLKGLLMDFLKSFGVENITEFTQQFGEAGVEALTGITPQTRETPDLFKMVGSKATVGSVLASALDVIPPMTFMMLVTLGFGTAGHVLSKQEKKDKEGKEKYRTGEGIAESVVPDSVLKDMGAEPGVGAENAPDLREPDRVVPEEGAAVPDFASPEDARVAGINATDDDVNNWKDAQKDRKTEFDFLMAVEGEDKSNARKQASKAFEQYRLFGQAIEAAENPERFAPAEAVPTEAVSKIEASIEEFEKSTKGKPFDFEDPQDYKWLKSLGYTADEIYYASQMPGVHGRVKTRKLQEPSELPGTTPPVYATKKEASIELAPETKAQLGLFKEKKKRARKIVEKWIQPKDEVITDEETGKRHKAVALTPEAETALHKAGVQTGAGPFRPGTNFVVSITDKNRSGIIYGPARASDKKTTRTKDLLTGKETITEYWRTIGGKEFKVLNTPTMPRTKEARVKLMDKLVNEFKKDLTWYTDWREFMTTAEGKQPDQDKINKLMKIQVILSAGASPQGAQTAYGKVIRTLEQYGTFVGGDEKGATKDMAGKINRVWQGLDKDIVTLEQMQKAYGPKIGAMMFAALHPMAREGGVVVDRHIARLWGYNAMWGGSFRVPNWLQEQVENDITETARRMDLPVPAVQAALWYSSGAGHWGSATRFEEAIRIAPKKSLGHEMAHLITMEPQAITSFRGHLYFTLHGATMPIPLTQGEKTRLGDLEFKVRSLNFAEDQLTAVERAELLALQHKQEGTAPSPWSRDDVQKRMDASTDDNKYASLTYWYGPGVRRESFFWGKEPHLTRIYQDEIYDAIEDRLGYKDIAWQRALNDPEVKAGRRNASDIYMNALANTIAKAGKTPEGRDFKGFALERNGNTWMFTFDDMVVEEHPTVVDVGLSDLVGNLVKLPTDLQDLADVSSSRVAKLIDHLQEKLKDYPVTVDKLVPTLARFGEVTSGETEYGVALRVRGPISAIRAAFSDVIGLQKNQNSVILFHQSGATNGNMLTFKFASGELKKIQKSLRKYEVSDFNLRFEGDGWTFQTFVPNDMENATEFIDNIVKLYENKGVEGSLTHVKTRAEMLTREKMDETYPTDYETHILKYYGKTKGGEVYDRSTKAGGEWTALSALLSGTEVARSGVKGDEAGAKRSIRDGFREPTAKERGPEAKIERIQLKGFTVGSGWDTRKIAGNQNEIKVGFNPTETEVRALEKNSKTGSVRGFVSEDGDLYVWDAHEAIHAEVAHAYGVPIDEDYTYFISTSREDSSFDTIGKMFNEWRGYKMTHSLLRRSMVEAMVAGESAAGAPTGNLSKAKQLRIEGKSSDEIWKKTGWKMGADGLWRFEIDDTKATVRDTTLWKDKATRPRLKNNWPDLTWTTPITLGRIFEHKVLFGYYPALRDVKVEVDRSTGAVGASYNPVTKTIEIAEGRFKDGADLIESVFHETQHAIQDIEGFAMGSSPYLEYMRLKADPKYKGWGVNRLAKLAEENYLKVAGEIESLDTTERLMLTSRERARIPLYSSAQVEMDKWLIRGKGTSFSVKKDAAVSLMALNSLQAPTAVAQMIQDALTKTGVGNYTEVLKRLQVLLTPKIVLKFSDLSPKSQRGNAQALGITVKQLEEGMNKGLYQTAGLSEVTDSMHALVTLALKGRSLDKVELTLFHELWHVAEKWIIPEATLDKLILLVPDSEERANLFRDYVTKRMTVPQPTWMQKVWDDILMFLQTLRGGLTSLNISSAEQVFENTILGRYQPHFGASRLIDKKNGVWASTGLIKDLDDMESGPANITSVTDGENQFPFESEKTAKKHIEAMVDNWHKMEPQMFGFMYPTNVATPAFKDWFRKSMVTDRKTGRLPLQVYHGTHVTKDFSTFREVDGRAGWFSESATLSSDVYATAFMNHARLMPVYLRIENPYSLPVSIDSYMTAESFHKEAGIPGTLDDWFPKGPPEDTQLYMRSRKTNQPVWAFFKQPELIAHLKKHGYDGVYAIEKNADTWMAFDPKQVKSVFNPGTWSRQDADIMASIEKDPTWVPPKGQSQSEVDLNVPGVIEIPEMLEIVKMLTGGKIPGVRKKLFGKDSIRGVFMPGHGIIRLQAGMFKDTLLAARVLAHEIGHLVDWLPDHVIKGNILGKIASIRDFIEHVLPYKPGAPGVLTEADIARLRAEAIQLLGMVQTVRTKWIDTQVTEELKVTADDLLNIWNAVEKAKLFSPELYKYIAGLDTNAKKMIAKAALKGLVTKDVQEFARKMKGAATKTAVTETVMMPPDEATIAAKLAQLLEKEIKLRKLWVEEEVRDELKTLSARWKPFDPSESARFTQYRWSSAELYADAVSVLFNDPAFLKAQAPKFYEAFFNYLDSKPEVKKAYFEIQRQLHSGEVDKRRTENQYRMYDKGNEDYGMQYEELSPSIKDALKRDFIDTFHFILKDVRKIGDANIPVNDNPRYKLEDMVYTGSEVEGFTTDLYTNVIKILEQANLKWDREFGLLTLLRRIAVDRAGLAQPGGFDAEKAINKMEAMKNVELSPEQWQALKTAVTNFRALHERYFIDKAEKAQIYDDAMIKRFRDNTTYATFDVLSYLEERYGHSVATRVYQQVGTLQDISNPATATVMKDIAFIKAVNKNTAVRTTVKFYQDYASVLGIEVIECTPQNGGKKWNGRFQAIQKPKDKKLGLVVYLYKGKAYGYYLPKDIAEALNESTTKYASTARIFRWLSQPFRKIFTELNYGFWIFNAFFRDAQRMVMTLPGWRVDQFAKHWVAGLKPAFKSAFGIPDDVVQQMQRDHMLISIASVKDLNDEEQQIERLMKMYHMKGPAEYHSKILTPFGHMFNWIANRARLAEYYFVQTGQALERTTKVGSYTYLKEKFPDMPTPVLAHLVRNAGSPDFLRAGREQALYNNILLFSNAMKEGNRGDIEAFKDHPGEYMMKKMVFMAVPKLLMYAGLIGLLGAGIRDIFKGVTEYDLTNYLIIPLGRTRNGKSVYWRVPTDETSRFLGGILWKIFRAPELGITHEAGDLFDYMAGQAPTVSPALGVIADTLDYVSGKNPYDRFYGRHAVGEVEFAAKDMRAHLQFLKYIAGKLGASIVYKFKHDKVEKVAEELESVIGFPVSSEIADFAIKSVDAPVVSNILGRFLKVTDYGIREDILRAKKEIKRENARGILDAREAAYAIVQGETPNNKQLLALAQKPDVVDRAMMLSLARKYGMLYFEEWMSAGSLAEKFAVLKIMMEQNALSYKDVTGRDAPPPSKAPTAPAPSSEYPGLNIQELLEKETRR